MARNPVKVTASGLRCPVMLADLTDAGSLNAALSNAEVVVSCAHARFASVILNAAPAARRFVFLGSTRRFTLWPDDHGNGVLAGEAAFMASGRPGVMLHPTMIYGATGENNVQRLARLLRVVRVAPLPGGGRSLVQPIHQDDVVACVIAALAIDWKGPNALVVAGPRALTYADFCRAVAKAAGLGRVRVASLPMAFLSALAPLTRLLPFLPSIGPDELRRLGEDKAFPIDDMRRVLGVEPRDLQTGLAQTFA